MVASPRPPARGAAGRAPAAAPGAIPLLLEQSQERLGRGVAGRVKPGLIDVAELTPVGLEGERVLGEGLGRLLDRHRLVPPPHGDPLAGRSPSLPPLTVAARAMRPETPTTLPIRRGHGGSILSPGVAEQSRTGKRVPTAPRRPPAHARHPDLPEGMNAERQARASASRNQPTNSASTSSGDDRFTSW